MTQEMTSPVPCHVCRCPSLSSLHPFIPAPPLPLPQYFHLPSEEACKRLGVGLTVLKRQCRKYGILRWPYRKIKSLDKLIENVRNGHVPGDRSADVISRKVDELEMQKARMLLCQTHDLDEETKRLQQAYSKASHKLRKARGTAEVRAKDRPAIQVQVRRGVGWGWGWRCKCRRVRGGVGGSGGGGGGASAGAGR